MNTRISLIALVVSIASLTYAAWVHHQAEAIAQRVVAEREARLVMYLTPHVRGVCIGFGVPEKMIPTAPRTLEELLQPLDEMSKMATKELKR